MNRETSAAWHYHNLTKHSYESVRKDRHYLDWETQPLPFKVYPDLPPIPLPREWEELRSSALAALNPSPVGDDKAPTLTDLSALLYFSAGILKSRRYPGGEMFFRAASCTGALYEIEIYLVCRDLEGLRAGVYHFNPGDFSLRLMRPGDYRGLIASAAGDEPSLLYAPVVLIFSGTFWRNAWKYRNRTYRHFGWDNGTILANTLAVSVGYGLSTKVVLGFEDETLNELLNLDVKREVVLSLVSLGRDRDTVLGRKQTLEPLKLGVVAQKGEIDYPEMRQMHSATFLTSAQEVAEWRSHHYSPKHPAPQGESFRLAPAPVEKYPDSVERVISRRGSSRSFQRKSITFEQFSTILHYASLNLWADFLSSSGTLNDWYLIVHDVDGVQPGSYFFHRDRRAIELLRTGNFRNLAGRLGLEQALPADAAFDVFFLSDLHAVLEALGNRGYRAAQLEAGILGGKIYLASYAVHLGATGLTFYDDEVADFFSPHARGKSAIFLMACGPGRKRPSAF
ncbi:MAG: SagB/ThcOx family dehydrogenase [Acidobacteria bacterium]|nr:SagB/ThcOx family dehydrogenase [Acidobacteriota bacterium]